MTVTDDIAAICVSRPTNPTGNVLTDEEIARLSDLAKSHGIPLIIDNAYGAPFPNIIFTDAKPVWDEHIILTLSLSKIGLPGTRTGIVIANPKIAAAVASMSAIIGLANPNIGQAIAQPLVEKIGNALVVEMKGDLGVMHADLTKVRQCLFNLLSNAAKFTEHGTITLTVGGPHLPAPSPSIGRGGDMATVVELGSPLPALGEGPGVRASPSLAL